MRMNLVPAVVLLAGVPSGAFAQTVTIHAAFTERQLISSVRTRVHGQRLAFGPGGKTTGWLNCADPNCFPSSYTGSGPTAIRARYVFTAEMDNLSDAKVTAIINLGFGCPLARSRLISQVTLTDITIDLPVGLRLALPGIGELIQDFVRDSASGLTGDVMTQLTEEVSFDSFALPVCPRFATTTTGDVIMDFTSGTQCSSGDRQEESCPSGQSGRGRAWACSNGWWQVTMNDCRAPQRLPRAVNPRNYALP